MKHRLLYIPIVILFLLAFVDCAKKGTPSGGAKDTIPPIIERSSPENYTINFAENEIEIRFNEYIKLKDINKELIISPPMKYAPLITPLNTSKSIKIKIQDTLKPNTTYTINFGKSIVDNNEENAFEYFKYIFSTGSYIDSLKISGSVTDAQRIAPEIPTTVMLYEINEVYTDSIIYSEKPTYVTVTKDSTGVFELTNLKEGNYLLLALKEADNNYTFQPQKDRIGFADNVVSLPTDSTYIVTLFKEEPDYKLGRPSQIGSNHIVFGYSGFVDSIAITPLSAVPTAYISTMFKDETKDTIHYWYKPIIETDSLTFKITHKQNIDTAIVRMRKLFKDSLTISAVNKGVLKLKDTFALRANTPLISFDPEKFQAIRKDSSLIIPTVKLNKKYNLAEIIFEKAEDQNYTIKLFPGALTDFFEKTNDTLQFNISTKISSDYGTLNLSLLNTNRFPIIVQMVDTKYNVIASSYLTENRDVFFDELTPAKYFLRVIYDDNQNRRWDSGSFLNRLQAEKIVYYPTQIEVRANWSLNETFTLK